MLTFKNRTEIKAERDALLGKMNWKWKGKNILGMPYSKSLKADFPKQRAVLHHLGYSMNKTLTSLTKNHVTFTIGDKEDADRWFVEMNEKEYTNDIMALFEWIDENFEIGENYLGSKEWKRHICKKYDIPMTGALSYLDPPKGYWFLNELKK